MGEATIVEDSNIVEDCRTKMGKTKTAEDSDIADGC